jgi:hypothetical protein
MSGDHKYSTGLPVAAMRTRWVLFGLLTALFAMSPIVVIYYVIFAPPVALTVPPDSSWRVQPSAVWPTRRSVLSPR